MSADSEILTQLTEAVSKLTNNALSTTKIQALAVKLPEFGQATRRFGFFEPKHNLDLNL